MGDGRWGIGGMGDRRDGGLGDWETGRFVAVLLPFTLYPLPFTPRA